MTSHGDDGRHGSHAASAGNGQRQKRLLAWLAAAATITLSSLWLASHFMPRSIAPLEAVPPASFQYQHGAAASGELIPELRGARGTPRQQAEALRRMRSWPHGLADDQPLRPADVAEAAGAILAAGKRLRPDYGVTPTAGPRDSAPHAAFGLRSYYTPWILADLALWADTGISREMIDAAAAKRLKCHGSALRLFVVNGTVWVDHLSPRPDPGWYPAGLGEGWLSGKGRVPYVILTLMDIIRTYGKEVPDVDFVIGCGDAPCAELPKPPPDPPEQPPPQQPAAPAAKDAAQQQGRTADAAKERLERRLLQPSAVGSGSRTHIASHSTVVDVGCGSGSRVKAGINSSSLRQHSNRYHDDSLAAHSESSCQQHAGIVSNSRQWQAARQQVASRRLQGRNALDGVPIPMFSYDTDVKHSDIPFPDFSYWGHEQDRLWAGKKKYIIGWETQREYLQKLSAKRPWGRRADQVTWRGRTHPTGRDQLRWDYVQCRERFFNESNNASAVYFNFYWPDVALPQLSLYRYNIYIESGAWATNLKHKLASGSPVFALDPAFPEFFARALLPGVHYIPLPRGEDKCNATVRWIRAMDASYDQRVRRSNPGGVLSLLSIGRRLLGNADSSSGATSSSSSAEPLLISTDGSRDSSISSATARRLLVDTGSSGVRQGQRRHASSNDSPSGSTDHISARQLLDEVGSSSSSSSDRSGGSHTRRDHASGGGSGDSSSGSSSGSSSTGGRGQQLEVVAAVEFQDSMPPPDPAAMVAAVDAFLDQHLRMEDVRRYLLDVLRVYASLQTFQVRPTKKAVCYDGAALLEQFGTPFKSDAAAVSGANPWLADFDADGCPASGAAKSNTNTLFGHG